jgi:hypothetical protein
MVHPCPVVAHTARGMRCGVSRRWQRQFGHGGEGEGCASFTKAYLAHTASEVQFWVWKTHQLHNRPQREQCGAHQQVHDHTTQPLLLHTRLLPRLTVEHAQALHVVQCRHLCEPPPERRDWSVSERVSGAAFRQLRASRDTQPNTPGGGRV